jgi:hypothetical protein
MSTYKYNCQQMFSLSSGGHRLPRRWIAAFVPCQFDVPRWHVHRQRTHVGQGNARVLGELCQTRSTRQQWYVQISVVGQCLFKQCLFKQWWGSTKLGFPIPLPGVYHHRTTCLIIVSLWSLETYHLHHQPHSCFESGVKNIFVGPLTAMFINQKV